MLKPHHKLYAADAELIADARARRISLAMLEALEPVDDFNADEEDELIARRAVAAPRWARQPSITFFELSIAILSTGCFAQPETRIQWFLSQGVFNERSHDGSRSGADRGAPRQV